MKKALDEAISVMSKRGVKTKRVTHDGEKSIAGNHLSLNELSKEVKDECDIIMKPLPKGAAQRALKN